MCGINGFICKNKVNNAKIRINRMNEALVHRGPDAGGITEIQNGYFGHRRLSIIDVLERSNQPMWSLDSEKVIVFNGEIYNYKELKTDIDYRFVTDSDTEVLLAGISQNGINWIKNTNGMFAFAYYDGKQLILARDRFGIKPLFYYYDGSTFVFSSEINGILNSGLVEAELNESVIDEYLGNRYVREPYTFFKNIYQVPSGSYLILDEDYNLRVEKYWTLPQEFNMCSEYNEEEIYIRFKDELYESIRRRMIADVPIGTYLSGGIDSSIISAICTELNHGKTNTYTIGFDELNEFAYARMVSEKYQTVHHELKIDINNYFELMTELIKHKGSPLGVPNEVPLAIMSKELKKEITVVLSGEGADELLGGYGQIFRAAFDYKNIDANSEMSFYDYFIRKYEYVSREIRNKYLMVSLDNRFETDERIREEFNRRKNEENIFRFFHEYHVKGLLQRVDMTTMYASVEARVPFLDHKLVEFVYKEVPYELKIKWNNVHEKEKARKLHAFEYSEVYDNPKYLLRRLGLEMLPNEVVTRKKMGFPVPLSNWFDELVAMAQNILIDSYWFDYSKIVEFFDECKNDKRSGQLIWMFVNFEIFRKYYFNKSWKY